MTVEEKIAQLCGVWLGFADGGVVAPEMDTTAEKPAAFSDVATHGIGQVTRVFGTKPVTPAQGLATLVGYQRWLRDHTRLKIGAVAHEECLTGLSAWTATTFPTPLAWAASFDPALTYDMAHAIGLTMTSLGVHQGLAPVLDVVADIRWGRVEETMGEDPYLVATLGKSYVEGLQSTGVVATLKHFVGYSASAAGRNLAPVHAGLRELEDVFLFPFEVGVLDAQVGSVLPAYVDIDCLPVHADRHLLTEILRDRWGFTGTVVADYFGIAFLFKEHGVATDLADAAAQSLLAGMDVELPSGDAFRDQQFAVLCHNPPLAQALDTAVTRVLSQKEVLGLLDLDAEIARLEHLLAHAPETLDPDNNRAIASQMAEESVILLDNHNVLPLADRPGLRIGVVGPNADRQSALFGCYSFINHVLMHNPTTESRIAAPTLLDAIRTEYPQALVTHAVGCPVRHQDRTGFAQAIKVAQEADLVIAVMGDQAGLFGRGTSGEGCDADSLDLPGVQSELLDALLDTGTPVVLVLITGRPYAIKSFAERAAATLQAFFPGEAGAAAIAGVIAGRINPSGHLPVSVPRTTGVLPYSYLHPPLGDAGSVSSVDNCPQYSFGHGLSYTSFGFTGFSVPDQAPTDGWIEVAVQATNTGPRDGHTLIQVYGRDPVASITRPLRQLLAYTRVFLEAGQSKLVTWRIPAARFGFHNRDMARVVEPGTVRIWLGWDCDHEATDVREVLLTGPDAPITNDTARLAEVIIT